MICLIGYTVCICRFLIKSVNDVHWSSTNEYEQMFYLVEFKYLRTDTSQQSRYDVDCATVRVFWRVEMLKNTD